MGTLIQHYQPETLEHVSRETLLDKLSGEPLVRQDWSLPEVQALLSLPMNDLLFHAQARLRRYFDPNAVQLSTLLSIKTGYCPENCAYCTQSAHHQSKQPEDRAALPLETILQKAKDAKASGASRFCMGAAWRNVHDRDLPYLQSILREVKALGLESCMTLGLMNESQAHSLKEAGLDYYNHNLDTSRAHYSSIVSTHTYDDRLKTIEAVRKAGISLCSGAIVGLGEGAGDRAQWLLEVSRMNPHPESVPINQLIPMPGTPLEGAPQVDPLEFVRVVASARILMPSSFIRLSAGREQMSEAVSALCFAAGANSVFFGDCLLTAKNPQASKDLALFSKLGLKRLEGSPESGSPRGSERP